METRMWKTSSIKNFETVSKNVEEHSGKEKTSHAHLSAKSICRIYNMKMAVILKQSAYPTYVSWKSWCCSP